MMRRGYSFVFCVLLLAGGAVAAEPFRYPEAKHGKSELKHVQGLPVLVLQGAPEEIGEAAGVLALKPAGRIVSYPEELIRYFGFHFLWRPALRAGQRMVERFPDDYRTEMEATARAAQIDRDAIVAGNTLFDIKKLFCCSAIVVDAARSSTRGPLLGRNLDYPALGYMHEYSLLTVYRPTGKHAFACVGFPGVIGCLSGMNDAGLAVSVLEVFQVKAGEKRFSAAGLPYALCYRRLLEECTTIDEARDLLAKMERTTITNLAIADKQGVAIFEVSPGCVAVRRPLGGASVCTNHFCTEALRPHVPFNFFTTFERYEILTKAVEGNKPLGAAELQESLDAVRFEHETLHTMVFEPATLKLHLSMGTCPSSAAKMKPIDLAPLFCREER